MFLYIIFLLINILIYQAYIKVLETDNVNYEALHNLYQIYKLNHRLDRFKKYLPRLSNPNQFPL